MRLKLQKLWFLDRRQFLAIFAVVLILCAVLAGVFIERKARAATASTINFQARLMNDSGSIAPDGFYNIEFKLYDTASSGGTAQGVCSGNCLWRETRTGVNTVRAENGYITVNLGSVTSFGASIDWDQELWLTMRVGGTGTPSWDTEMSPRLKLTAVPYAFSAGKMVTDVGGSTGVLQFAGVLGQDSVITLPDPGASGTATICYQGSSSCGFVTGNSTNFIQNGTSVQTAANFNIRSAATGSVGAVIQGASGQTADLLNLQTWDGASATTVFGVNSVGALTLNGNGTTSFTTTKPVPDQVPTKINIPAYNPGNFGQILAFGLPSTASSTSRAISVFDARSVAHQPTIAVLSPNENEIAGFSWDGSNTAFLVKNSSSGGSIGLNVGGTTRLSATATGVDVTGLLSVSSLGTAGTVTYLCRNGSNQIASCNTTGNGAAFTQGGNDFNASAVLGSTDTDNLQFITNNVVRATFNTSNGLYLGNGVTAAAPANFTVSGTGSTTSAVAGGSVIIQGGNATVGNANGGNLTLTGGSGVGTGARGLVVIDTPTFTTSSTQNCSSNCNITQANIDNSAAVLINATNPSLTVNLSDPTIQTAGRIMYVTNVGANDFTLSVNGGGTGNTIAMKPNTTATMIWNGSDWTAAGASSSTDLQSAYNNTLTSAGGAELVLNAPGGSADGLTIRNNATTPITGGLLEVQNSIGSNIFSVNNNATEYANNGGAESSTFTMWTTAPTAGGTVTRYTTTGDNIATGTASVSVDSTSTANTGVRNTLSTTLTRNLRYRVSFAVRHTSAVAAFTTLDVRYSPTGTTTDLEDCSTGNKVNYGQWTRIICTFVYDNATTPNSSNAIVITHSDAVDHDYYVDNLSVTVSADVNHAVDGSVDLALGSNWTNFGTLDNLTRDTAVIYDTGGSVSVDTPSNADRGVANNLAITPATSTQYLVTFYARSSNTFNDIRVRYSRDGGTNFVSCVDYNTQTVSTTSFTEITCLFTTDSTTATNPDLIIDQPTASNRVFYIDALTVTLNTNNSNNVQIGGANKGGPVTLFTLDRSNGAPIAANNEAYLGSMYYDTESGRIQCYEADGWGACGAAPDNIVNLNPEYAGAVLNGSGIGTMTADFCSNDTALTVNNTLCSTGEAKNFYRWTSPQATQQTYSIYVTYQLPATFNGFASDDTVQLIARVDNTTNASVTYEMFKSTGSAVTKCGTGETNVITGGGGSSNTWYSYGINGNEATGCSFNGSSAGDFIIFKINLKANSNASAYVSTLSFTTTGR